MKKILSYILLAVLSLSFWSCENDYEVFDQTPAQRTAQALQRYKFALQANEYWVMEYFPDDELRYGGWVYVVRFDADNRVRAWFEGESFVELMDIPQVESEYAVEFSTGPMLKFTTHNDYLHYFSQAGYNGSGYQGWKGDYEFTIMSMSAAFDEIILRGIKTGNRIRLTPLSGEYTPESYIASVISDQQAQARRSFRVMANGEQIATIDRPSSIYLSNFSQFAASKVWTIHYSYEELAVDSSGQQIFDAENNPVYRTVQVDDPLCVIYLPGNIMKLYAPYTFKGDVVPMLSGQTMQTFQWQLGVTSASDSYVCRDSFFDFQLVP